MSLAAPYQEHYYIADGVTTSFSFGEYFTALASANVKCIIYFEDGTNCVPTFTVDMTTGYITIVTLTKPDGTVLTVPPADSIVRVFRDTPEQQNVTASQLQNYTAKQLERIFDSVVAMIQEVSYSDLHKSIKLTETQRDVSVEQLTEEKDQSVLYWDFDSRTIKATDYGQDEVVKSDTVDRLVYLQPEGKIYFIPKGSTTPISIGSVSLHNDLGGRNAPDCHPESAITGLTQDLQELRDKDLALDEDVQTALNRSQEAKDTADEAKQIAEEARDIASDAKDIAQDASDKVDGFDDRLTQAESDASDAKSDASDAKNAVNSHLTDYNNPHQVSKTQVGLSNVDNTSDLDKPISTATQTALDGKQDVISDLATIRSGAALGATAVQPADLGDATLSIQKNGTTIDTFTANAKNDKVINISVPTQASDVNALPDTTKYAASASLTINSSTYVVSLQLKDQDNNNIGSAQTIDLPLESVVVSGSYDSDTKEVVLVLDNGSEIRFSVADLVSGLQTEITNDNKLDADLVDDSTSTNKFVSASDKTNWNGKAAGTNRVNGAPLSNTSSVFYGTSSTAAATLQKEVSIPSITTLDTGTIIIVQPTETSTVANSTIKLNSFAAYPMRYNNAAITTSTDSIVWNAAYPSVWVFDGTYWRFVAHGIDSNTTYSTMSVAEGTTGTATSNRVLQAVNLKQIIQGTTLTDIDVATTGAVSATDTITEGIGKLQATKADTSVLATVATTGDYDDLSNKPTIPAAQVNSDWNANSGVAQILNKPTLATVATSGSYNDLSDKPTIPTVNNATLTIQKNGTTVQTFTANQSTNATANISVPTKTSDITNDSGFITSSALAPYALSADLATVATSGSYNDLSDKPTIPTVNNPTITITQGGVAKGSFTLNQASGDTIELDAGGGGGSSYHPDLFDVKWADHICNDVQWLRADTYSWQSGAVYQAAYQHLEDEYNALSTTSSTDFDYNDNTYVRFPAEDHLSDSHPYAYANIYSYPVNIVYADEDYISMSGSDIYNGSGSSATNLGTVTSISTLTYRMPLLETIAGVKIMYYVAQDGHKIVLTGMESAVAAIYAATGSAWYYIIDTTNQRFKLPRELPITDKIKGNGLALGIGSSTTGYTEMGLRSSASSSDNYLQVSVAASATSIGSVTTDTAYYGDARRSLGIVSNPDKSGIISHRANENGKQYLYFYVGSFTQTALENTAGLNTELFNGKVDIGHDVIEFQAPTAANNYTWYRKYRDGWVEQGGIHVLIANNSNYSQSLPIAMADTHYTVTIAQCASNDADYEAFYYNQGCVLARTTTTVTLSNRRFAGSGTRYIDIMWQVSGMAA